MIMALSSFPTHSSPFYNFALNTINGGAYPNGSLAVRIGIEESLTGDGTFPDDNTSSLIYYDRVNTVNEELMKLFKQVLLMQGLLII